jgi:hypothetical protein
MDDESSFMRFNGGCMVSDIELAEALRFFAGLSFIAFQGFCFARFSLIPALLYISCFLRFSRGSVELDSELAGDLRFIEGACS